jgi:hypothetical protein
VVEVRAGAGLDPVGQADAGRERALDDRQDVRASRASPGERHLEVFVPCA